LLAAIQDPPVVQKILTHLSPALTVAEVDGVWYLVELP
jgi:hypothetical protein